MAAAAHKQCRPLINVPYASLLGVMTADGKERTTLATFRFIFAFAGSLVVLAAVNSTQTSEGWRRALDTVLGEFNTPWVKVRVAKLDVDSNQLSSTSVPVQEPTRYTWVVAAAGVLFGMIGVAATSVSGIAPWLPYAWTLIPVARLAGETWRRRGFDKEEIETLFPFEDYEDLLLNWAVTYTLNQNKYTTPMMDCIAQGGPAAHKFRRLRELIQQNLSYTVFQSIKDFKAALSSADEAVLDIPEIDVEIKLTRARFEELIGDLLTQFEQGVEDTLTKSGLAPNDIDLVLRTGGSSLIPAVRRILEERFPGRVVEHDPFTSVAAGLAIADYRGHRYA